MSAQDIVALTWSQLRCRGSAPGCCRTAKGKEGEEKAEERDEGVADLEGEGAQQAKTTCRPEEAVDYTPPYLISGIITESGVLLPSAVSEELIKIWF